MGGAMKVLPILAALALSFGFSAAKGATNLVQNPGFDDSLTSWMVTGTVTAVNTGDGNLRCSIVNGTLTQSIPTQEGVRYYVALDVSSSGLPSTNTLKASATGGAELADRSLPFTFTNSRSGMFFVATSNSTDISVTSSSDPIISGNLFVDNVVVYEAPTSTAFAGRYTGTAAVEDFVEDPALKSKSSRRIVAHVTNDNRITILDRGTVQTGVLLNDGTLELNLGALAVQGTATIRGKRITVTLPDAAQTQTDFTGETFTAGTRTILKLTRVARDVKR